MTAMPEASIDNASPRREPGTAREVIDRELRVESANEVDTIAQLRNFEVQSTSDSLLWDGIEALKPSHPVTACFDVKWSLAPSWVAMKRCPRCVALNQMIHVARHNKSGFTRTALGTALLVTQCDGEKRTGVVPTVPIEILEMFLNLFVDNFLAFGTEYEASIVRGSSAEELSMKNAVQYMNEARADMGDDDSSIESDTMFYYGLDDALVSLLRTSRFVRKTITKRLSAIAVPVVPSTISPESAETLALQDFSTVNPKLAAFIPEVLRWYLLDDWQRADTSVVAPDCDEQILTIDVVVRSIKLTVISLSEGAADVLDWHGDAMTGKTAIAQRQVDDASPPLTVLDACELLLEAFRRALPPPYEASLVHRIFSWTHGNTWQEEHDEGVDTAIKMELTGRKPVVWTFGVSDLRLSENRRNYYPWEGIENS